MQDYRGYLEVTFNTIDVGITIYDKDLSLAVWNEQYSNMGITPNEHLYQGASLLESYVRMAEEGVFGKGDPKFLAQRHIDALTSGPLVKSELLHAPGNRIIRINRTRLKDGGICATFRDVTIERKIKQQLRQAAKHDALGRLTSGLAHDLSNVLAIIVGSLELAQLDLSQCEKNLENALEASDRGAYLIRAFLAFSKQQPVKPTVTSVNTVLQNMKRMLEPIIRDYVTLEINTPNEPWQTEIDINQFESTVVNLVINAKDAIEGGGKVIIETQNKVITEKRAKYLGIESGHYVCVSVQDTGAGMTADVVEKAIDPFFTTKPPELGTGLGLSMAHGFARQSNGHLRIESQEKVGTTVTLYLPKSNEPASKYTDVSNEATLFEGATVVIVEDDVTLRTTVEALVRSMGCWVTSANSGEEVLAMINWEEADLLLTDIVMPNMHGTTLAEKALAINADLRVLYMSGYSDTFTLPNEKLKSVLIQKPFRRLELSRAMSEALRQ